MRWGRDQVFDEYSKLVSICQKTSTASEFMWVMSGVFCEMQSKSPNFCNREQLQFLDLPSVILQIVVLHEVRFWSLQLGMRQLRRSKAGSIQSWLFIKRVLMHMKKKLSVAGLDSFFIDRSAVSCHGVLRSSMPFYARTINKKTKMNLM